jgi:hypothetical protein
MKPIRFEALKVGMKLTRRWGDEPRPSDEKGTVVNLLSNTCIVKWGDRTGHYHYNLENFADGTWFALEDSEKAATMKPKKTVKLSDKMKEVSDFLYKKPSLFPNHKYIEVVLRNDSDDGLFIASICGVNKNDGLEFIFHASWKSSAIKALNVLMKQISAIQSKIPVKEIEHEGNIYRLVK